MTSEKLKFAIFGNEYQPHKSAATANLAKAIRDHGGEVYVDRRYYEFLTRNALLEKECVSGVFDDYNFDVDYVFSIGGDGTFLKAASHVGAKGTPIIGVNMGRLGFLADITPAEVDELVGEIYDGKYSVESHTVIMIEAEGEPIEGIPYALNDIAVLKRDNAAMISIDTYVNDEYLATYQADGLIISTPTGSTAYSLSNGGPIIVPRAGIMCLTPVAPHSLTVRPIVISDDSVLRIGVRSRSHNFLAAIDGRSEKLREGTMLTVRRAPFDIKIVKRSSHSYFSTLRERLMWGVDNRNR